MLLIGIVTFGCIAISSTGFGKSAELARRLLPFYFLGTSFIIAYSLKEKQKKVLQILIPPLLLIIIFGGTGIGTTRVRGVDSFGPKYYYVDSFVNQDIVAANNWINHASLEPIITDLLTSSILGLKNQNQEDFFSWEKVKNKTFFLNEKIQFENWEPNIVALEKNKKKYFPGDPVIKDILKNITNNNQTSLLYNNGYGKVSIN